MVRSFDWKLAASCSTTIIALAYAYLKHRQSQTVRLPPRSKGIASLIGNTPLVLIESLSELTGCEVYAKLELCNPAGSAKDRVALEILTQSEANGEITPNKRGGTKDVVFEGTSGSTGISFATLCNALGYVCHICLPDDTSLEKLSLLETLGAEIEAVKPASIVDPNQYVNAAKNGSKRFNNDANNARKSIFADQFENDNNWRVHYKTTGPEIWTQMGGDMDYFVTGSGTGGTISGVTKYLKEQDPSISVVLADPQGSGLCNRVNHGVMYDSVEREGTRRRHQVDTIIEGIGLNRVTWNFQQSEHLIDAGIRVTDAQALRMAKFLMLNDGWFWGSSAAINCVAAVKIALQHKGSGKKIVVVACDSGNRHLSKFWKEANKLPICQTLEEVIA
ncbi:hypothetical protein BABINDRAFT_162226 [Babjeviella inositovora NRRL Y-12698]|uniref:Tryptophan synthase beta chain-like PALP domain-containing protein n=1 Tax=Babjeviella inositovora NRRL Y-12698 TaxID=984486 RepID=A0A1E3QNC7_9ASCO|nr:uncharacterized protein BABINDRAFT_162226 [Babjeviella inositovora NRRL Y-12698]ODQ79181.1 hypothetical protein BABINDRAFT_162226 [Babjeviella inositovora NRRL Y-12698]